MSQQIVFVSVDELRNVFDDLEDIKFVLLNSLAGQISIMQPQSENMTCQDFHLLVGLHIVHVDDVQIVEAVVKRVADLVL